MSLASVPRVTAVCFVLCGCALSAQTASSPEPAANLAAAAPAEHESAIRIVRLSQVKGEVRLDRGTGQGLEPAFSNLPIVQGSRLATTEKGVAEVEFEDNSSLRLTPGSLVDFPNLALRPSGVKHTTIVVHKGTVYVSLSNSKANDFTVIFGKDHFVLPPSSHVALSVLDPGTRLVVFDGRVAIETGSGAVAMVGKKKSLVFDPAGDAPPTLASHHEAGPYDAWDKTSAGYHTGVSNLSAFGGSSNLSGLNDLNYYGSFVNGGAGCGSVWRPYFASAAWDPFANGTWALYPGTGYSWVSPYPWGWTPFHSGSWAQCGTGWGWTPGSNWSGLQNTAAIRQPVGSSLHPQPPLPPGIHSNSLVPVNAHPLSVSRFMTSESFEFRKDSAGLGVPREGMGKLGKVSAATVQHGAMTTSVGAPVAPGFSGISPVGTSRSVVQAGAVHASANNGVPNGSFGRPTLSGPGQGSLAGSPGRAAGPGASGTSAPAATGGTRSR